MSVSAVSADDNVTADIQEFEDEINNANDTLNVTKDYICSNDEISINKNITIDGNNHTILAKDENSILKINVSNSSNLVFKNFNFNVGLQFNNNSANITLFDAYFNISIPQKDINVINEYHTRTFVKDGAISSTVAAKAKSIVGKSTGIDAIKKLAVWVGKYVKHESHAGFYQSPDVTLSRKRGNCCCQSLLFLQMCRSLGLTAGHVINFVHVGQYDFGKRHFFVTIDNLCVDVNGCPDSPWGDAKFSNRPVYLMTQYPVLPLPIEY